MKHYHALKTYYAETKTMHSTEMYISTEYAYINISINRM